MANGKMIEMFLAAAVFKAVVIVVVCLVALAILFKLIA